MDFKNLFNNQKTVTKLLKNSFDQDRLFHTYLFAGPRGSLKFDASMYLASLVLCDEGGSCGKCKECVGIDKYSNEHLYIVSADGDSIKKEQIEALEHEFGYSGEEIKKMALECINVIDVKKIN